MPEVLRRQLEAGNGYLAIELVTGKTMLSDGSGIFRRPGGPGWVQFVCVDLQAIFRKFQREAPPGETFTLTEVARMVQEQSPTVNAWVRSGALTPSVRNRDGTRGRAMLFDRTDAFVACLVASLKRKCGLQLKRLREISDVLRDTPPQARKRRAKRSTGKRKNATSEAN